MGELVDDIEVMVNATDPDTDVSLADALSNVSTSLKTILAGNFCRKPVANTYIDNCDGVACNPTCQGEIRLSVRSINTSTDAYAITILSVFAAVLLVWLPIVMWGRRHDAANLE